MSVFIIYVYIQNLNKLITVFFIYEKVDKGTKLSQLINNLSLFLSQSLSFEDGDQRKCNYLCTFLHFSYFQNNYTNAPYFSYRISHFASPSPYNAEMLVFHIPWSLSVVSK